MGILHRRSRVHCRGQSDCRPYGASGYVHGWRRFLLGAGRIFWATSTKLGRVNGSQNDLKQVVLRDRSYAFLTNGDGDIEICSEAASERFDGPNRQNLAQCLMSIFANPDPLLFRLFTQSASTLLATEQVKTRKGITACR